ncbi:MAG TPA: STAS domain-containing protein [Noviherbaspirillum sp.]|uniref:STAS domain-containing protein n=1 Tax=Noviherbaspirillum sp. TaxID=1926288 RepID=UPI002B465711|nr:STAS domain-containing protein [Noviherbaspirillum sp.]HJV87240.1 STAS domain-containing protein [Noviherbaspirillum sp.]
MGIFSLFGKKGAQPANPAEKDASRAKRQASSSRPDTGKTTGRSQAARRDAQAALATAQKIDAIESEMSSEFVNVTTTQLGKTTIPGPHTVAPRTQPVAPVQQKQRGQAKPSASPTPSPAPKPAPDEFGTTTEFLLGGETAVDNVAAPASEATAVVEEAAILYANGQSDMVEQMLRAAVAEDNLGSVTRNAWWMLFDLYQILGRQMEFEQLSIEYANKFETSPPAWVSTGKQDAHDTAAPSKSTPMVSFSGKLDEGCTKLIDRIQKLAESNRALRLEFARVSEVDSAGCRLLLGALNRLQKSGHELILVGAPELADKIRAILEVGRRDDTEDSWLLLLEILRLLNREKDFEETSIDYCVTFEVSPPAFVAPRNKVTTAAAEAPSGAAGTADVFMMPALVQGKIDNLILAIAAFSDEHSPAIVDCSRVTRVDFNAAGRLLTGLAPFCGNGKAIEFHQVNHLVAELFSVIGLNGAVRVHPRKN